MSAQFYVHKAKADVTGLRRRLNKYGCTNSLDQSFDIRGVAEAYLGCEIVALPDLSDRAALQYLHKTYEIDVSREQQDDRPLAGGLYVTATGLHRWIFLEQYDAPSRQRFTIAHELAHLVLEAEPTFQNLGGAPASMFGDQIDKAILRFGRCPAAALDATDMDDNRKQSSPYVSNPQSKQRGFAGRVEPSGVQENLTASRSKASSSRWSEEQLREIVANHFAAELLLPYEGVRQIIAATVGPQGVRTSQDLVRLADVLAEVYQVSAQAAKMRLTKDLAIIPISEHSNPDLFA